MNLLLKMQSNINYSRSANRFNTSKSSASYFVYNKQNTVQFQKYKCEASAKI